MLIWGHPLSYALLHLLPLHRKPIKHHLNPNTAMLYTNISSTEKKNSFPSAFTISPRRYFAQDEKNCSFALNLFDACSLIASHFP